MLGMLLSLAGGIVWFIARAAKRFDAAYASGPESPLAPATPAAPTDATAR